jgi:hypothetical protein
MTSIKDAAAEFLTHHQIAVTGVSREPANHRANVVYQRLRECAELGITVIDGGCPLMLGPRTV